MALDVYAIIEHRCHFFELQRHGGPSLQHWMLGSQQLMQEHQFEDCAVQMPKEIHVNLSSKPLHELSGEKN